MIRFAHHHGGHFVSHDFSEVMQKSSLKFGAFRLFFGFICDKR